MITLTEILIFIFYSDKSILKINAERNFEFNFQQTPILAMHAIYSVGLGKRKISMF